MSDVRDIALLAVSRFRGLPIRNVRRLVEGELSFWEEEIFPVLDDYLIPRYHFVCEEILGRMEGYEQISPKKLSDVVFKVRQKRAKQGDSHPVQPSALRSARSPVIASIPPETSIHTTHSKNSAVPPVKLAPIHSIRIEPDWIYADELARLKEEGIDAEWTEQDEKLYSYLQQEARDKFLDLKHEFYKVEQLFVSSLAKSVMSRIYSKRTNLGFEI